MPNWCSNFIQIRHKDPAMIDRVQHSKGLLMEFMPTPKPLLETMAGSYGDGEKQRQLEMQQLENLKIFGAKDWYDWNIANWGTKWDFELEGVERHDENFLSAYFDSAWAPPIEAYSKLLALGFEIDAMYYEPGMGFCGRWIDGADDYYELGGLTSDQVSEQIDSDIDEQFAISENMAEWEAENQE